MLDDIIDDCDLPSGGSYTAVGTYDHQEIVSLVSALSQRTDISIPTLLQVYGEHLFTRFPILYPGFFSDENANAFSFLEQVESYIHVEVKKLYPDAELPRFDTQRVDDNTLVMIYHSGRHLEDVAEGLIRGCFKHFGEDCDIVRVADPDSEGIKFTLQKRPDSSQND